MCVHAKSQRKSLRNHHHDPMCLIKTRCYVASAAASTEPGLVCFPASHTAAFPDSILVEEDSTSVAHFTGNRTTASPDFIPVEKNSTLVAHLTGNLIPVSSNSTGISAYRYWNQFAQLRCNFTSTKKSSSQFVYSTDITSCTVTSATAIPSIAAGSSGILCTIQTRKGFHKQSTAIMLLLL